MDDILIMSSIIAMYPIKLQYKITYLNHKNLYIFKH